MYSFPRMRGCLCLFIAAVVLVLTGCHSKYVEATIVNGTDAPINVVQVDYPSASFGTQALGPGATFRYRFKLQGNGPIKLSFTDSVRGEHQQKGPELSEGQEGSLNIVFDRKDHAAFETSLKP